MVGNRFCSKICSGVHILGSKSCDRSSPVDTLRKLHPTLHSTYRIALQLIQHVDQSLALRNHFHFEKQVHHHFNNSLLPRFPPSCVCLHSHLHVWVNDKQDAKFLRMPQYRTAVHLRCKVFIFILQKVFHCDSPLPFIVIGLQDCLEHILKRHRPIVEFS